MNNFLKVFFSLCLCFFGSTLANAGQFPQALEVEQGQALEIRIPRGKATYIKATFEQQELLLTKEKQQFRGYLGVHRQSETGEKKLQISLFVPGQGFEEYSIPVTIKKRNYAVESFYLPKSKIQLFGKNSQNPTWDAIYAAMENPEIAPLWTESFAVPANGEITLGFGDLLYINKKYSGSHFGVDYANKVGTPIYATNNGIVKLAAFTPAYGNVILIDHGLNVFSMYLHLDKLIAKGGDQVQKGDLIATMGKTGIATGPHLHFTMFVGKIIVDSEPWMQK